MQLRRYVLTRRPAWALLAALLATGCSTQPVTGPPRAAAFNATDVAWIQLMIPMDERAAALLALAPERAGDPDLARFAADAARGQAADLASLRGLLTLSAAPDTRPHEGHDMPGMVRADTVRQAGALTGREFDRLLTASLRAHLAQSSRLCAGERSSGGAAEARELAAAIEKAGAEQSARLDAVTHDES